MQMKQNCKYAMAFRHTQVVRSSKEHAVAVMITTLRLLNFWKPFQSVISTFAQVPRMHACCLHAAPVASIALSAFVHQTRQLTTYSPVLSNIFLLSIKEFVVFLGFRKMVRVIPKNYMQKSQTNACNCCSP